MRRAALLPLLAALFVLLAGPAGAQDRRATDSARTARGDTSSFWMSDEASADSLDAFWDRLQTEWQADLPDSLREFGITDFRVDSLQAIGAVKLQEMVAGTLWRSDLSWLQLPDYNRVQGPVVRMAWRLENVGLNRPVFRIQSGFGFGNLRPVGEASLHLPLLKRRWRLGGGRGTGDEYQLLAVDLFGRKQARRFAGDDRHAARVISAVLYGADPNHYYERRDVEARLTARLTRRASVWAGAVYGQERAQDQQMDWNLLNRDLSPDGNRRADGLTARTFAVGGDWRWGPLRLAGGLDWLRLSESAFSDRLGAGSGRVHLRRLQLRVDGEQLDFLGNRWFVRGRHLWHDNPAPLQMRGWLGDYNDRNGMLRGFEAGELSGDIASAASVDLRLNFDLWRTLRVPVLGRLGMQPILFADWGKTKNQDGPGSSSLVGVAPDPVAALLGEGGQDWRADVGFGFAVPALEPVGKIRIYAARPVGQGAGERDWRVLVAVER